MRTILALVVFALAFWRAALDWMATVAQGEAWRFISVGEFWGNHFARGPGTFETMVTGYLGAEAWRYLSFVLVMPLVSLLCFLGASIWMFRRPSGVARRSVFKR